VIARDKEGLSVNDQVAQTLDIDKFYLKNYMMWKSKNNIRLKSKISLQLLKTWMTVVVVVVVLMMTT
jgi:hypothetical protein